MSKNIKDTMTHEDCLKFKAEHPNLKRWEVLHKYRACYMAMKRLGCLDELYPSKNKTYPKELTHEDCLRFKREHPEMSRRDICSHHGKYYKAMRDLGCIDELYPSSKLAYSKKLTYDDCVKFRENHHGVSRSSLRLDYSGYYKAMERLNCLDELFPREIAQSYNTITYEECLIFKKEHPVLTRSELYDRYARYRKAMVKYGCLDELYPNTQLYAEDLTMEDCIKFREEHPDLIRSQVEKHAGAYYKAMKRYGLFDELYPITREVHDKYDDDYLIAEAKKYSNKRELREKASWLCAAIRSHNLQKQAYAHMEVLGNRKYRMIYAYEFSDHSVYVGLTFDYKKRGKDHAIDHNSAVNKHIKETGLTPIRKSLTDYLPVKEAQKMEGAYVEKYRREGWVILNRAKTGGAGSINSKTDYERAIELREQGMTVVQIAKCLGVDKATVEYHFRHAGLLTGEKKYLTLTIEQVDDDGNILQVFKSAKEAAEYYNVRETVIRKNIYSRHRLRGYYLRYNQKEYEFKRGKEYKYSTEIKKSKGTPKPVCQYTIDGEFVRRYNNARETGEYGFNFRHVSMVCNGKEKAHKGFVFRFENKEE